MRKTITFLMVAAAVAVAACIQVPTEYRLVLCVQSGDSVGATHPPCAVVDTLHP